jgi:spermidine synthase
VVRIPCTSIARPGLNGDGRGAGNWPFALYGLTGFAGLLAEQGFEKYLTLLTGATAAGAAVVIFSYFLGFAAGSALAGALLQRGAIRRPLRTYGTLEFLVGLSCIGFAFGFHRTLEALAPLQAPFTNPVPKFLARFVFGSVLILPAATLMGASFPLIADVVDRDDESGGRRWARAYAVNLAGASTAALLGPYAMLPLLGVRGSLWVCFATTALVFAVTRLLREPARGIQTSAHAGARGGLDADAWLLLAASFTSGAIFFVSEVLWTHLIGAVLGSSIYAFSSMLLMVLLGLLLGAWTVQRGAPMASAFLLQCCALAVLVQFRLWDLAQLAFLLPPVPSGNFYLAEAYRLLLAAVLIVPSAALLGTIFPSLLRSPTLKAPGRSRLLGLMNTANAVGCLSGALLGLFVMIPLVGSEASLKTIVASLTAGSLLFLWRGQPRRSTVAAALVLASLTLFCTTRWRWNRSLLTSGLNVYFGADPAASFDHQGDATSRLLYFHEAAQGGITTVVESSVTRDGGSVTTRTLRTNGKFQGNDAGEADAQIGFSLIPSQFVHRFDRALLIGLGTGHSALTLKRLGYQEVDVAEYAPGIVEAATTYFAHLNRKVLSDPSVRLVLEDGRNLLLSDRARLYDLITTEITSIWFAGATNVYAAEFYALAKRRMAPGAVLQQWVQVHHIGHDEIASAIATARSVFPYVSFWYFGGQGMIVASDRPQELEPGREAHLASRLGDAGERIRILHARLMTPEAVDAMIREQKPVINTDHNRWIEYATPRYNVSAHDWRADNVAFFTRR